VSYKGFLAQKIVPSSQYALGVRWCVEGGRCFETKAIIDSAGALTFEPVLSVGVWQEAVSVQGVRRQVTFFDGLGRPIAEYSIDISYLSDTCTITPGSVSFDVLTIQIDNALFEDAVEKDGPTIYEGPLDCRGGKQDWLRASASLLLRSQFNPSAPVIGVPASSGTTRQVVIRFNVSASGEDKTQILQ
jgi:hypothetical protein